MLKGIIQPIDQDASNVPPRPSYRKGYIAFSVTLVALAFHYYFQVRDSWFAPGYAVCSNSNKIYTVDLHKPRVECIAIRGGRILQTGSLAEVKSRRDVLVPTSLDFFSWVLHTLKPLNIIHLEPGHIVVPGLADAHAHVLEYGFKMQLTLEGSRSIEEVVERIKAYIISHPAIHNDTERWVEGIGWDQNIWPRPEFPTAADLDSDPILHGRPISLRRRDGHSLWVSPRVLSIIGLENIPEQVDGGVVLRHSNGTPTGIFLDNAMALIPRPGWSEGQIQEYYDRTMKDALAHGLTSIHDAAAETWAIDFLRKQAREGTLPLRMYLMGYVPSSEYWGSRIPRLIDYGVHGRLNVRSIKMFMDGAIGSWGAALLEPYTDKPETNGIMISEPEEMEKMITQFRKDGWQVNIHCIGDRANHVILNIFENITLHDDDIETWRPRIEHAQVMTLNDLERIGRLGVIPSVQPTHTTSDMWFEEGRLGPERVKGAHAFQNMLATSKHKVIPLGSDFPVEDINPLLGFYAAVSRLDTEGHSPHGDGGWFPEQRLTRAQALKGMTLDAAYASFSEGYVGSLEPSKKADFVVLDRDIMDEDTDFGEILRAKVKATVIDGVVAFGKL